MENETAEEQRAREWRFIEKQHEIQQKYMRKYVDYTLTILEPILKCELEKTEEWNSALQHVHNQENCKRIVWGHVLNHPEHILILFEWAPNTSQQQKEDDTPWQILEHLLQSTPQRQLIALNPPDLFEFVSIRPGPPLDELILIHGPNTLFTPPDPLKLFELESLALVGRPQMGHHPVEEFLGYAQGITPSTADEQRTIAVLWVWVDQEKRVKFMDPKVQSYGRNDIYDQAFGAPMRELLGKGARVKTYLCHLRGWRPIVKERRRRRRCVVM